ncbi:hypothetical protein H0H87_008338 [Tephrocybe sp. NHM501043]|nr:hypothetical protein H0H87_008338 [Tephrocybe sp. NHM501043]
MLGCEGAEGRTTIRELPVELLRHIFGFVSDDEADVWDWCGDEQDEEEARFRSAEAYLKDIRCLSLFPYSIASVCTTWRDVVSQVPAHWTYLAIFLDSNLEQDSVASFASNLRLSGDLQLYILVGRRYPEACSDHSRSREESRVREIMDIIQPHMRRCRSLVFDVTHTSSLPRIATDFTAVAPQLTYLSLRATVGNGLRSGRDDAPLIKTYQFPKLEEIDMDGWNFVDLFQNVRWWFDHIPRHSEWKTLTGSIAHYHPASDSPLDPTRFFLFDAFPIFSIFGRLELDDLDFDSIPMDMKERETLLGEEVVHVEYTIRLSRLSATFTGSIIDCLFAEVEDPNVVIDRCPLSLTERFPPDSPLELHGVESPEDLCRLLKGWQGDKLEVYNSPGFDDQVLDIIGSTWPDEPTDRLLVPCLTELCLLGCKITAKSLRKMVERRREVIKADLSLRSYAVLDTETEDNLRVTASVVDALDSEAEEDLKWFKENSRIPYQYSVFMNANLVDGGSDTL